MCAAVWRICRPIDGAILRPTNGQTNLKSKINQAADQDILVDLETSCSGGSQI